MLIATTAVALFASTAFAGAVPASASAVPPMIINVTAAPDVSPALVRAILAETDRIWRQNGVTFVWRRAAPVVVPYATASEAGPYVPNTVRLTIGDGRGAGQNGHLPLGWIVFDDETAPTQEIYLSYTNGVQMLLESRGVVGIVEQMPLAQRDTLLARAMGRALAHELGHYLLASKAHTARGLMRPVLGAVELFSLDSDRLRLEPEQRRIVAARLRGEPLVASR
jgi:hypothetical protein